MGTESRTQSGTGGSKLGQVNGATLGGGANSNPAPGGASVMGGGNKLSRKNKTQKENN